MNPKQDIKSLDREELAARFAELGEPAYRADQVLQWIYEKQAESFGQMSNLSTGLREQLTTSFDLNAVHALKTRNATDTTEKFLFQLRDHSLIETVLIPATPGLTSSSDRHTVCVSTQVGCAFACKFCASGLEGVKRNLTPAEIVDQVLEVQKLSGEKVNNIVVMGMGEPLANYDSLLRALKIINAPWVSASGRARSPCPPSALFRASSNSPMNRCKFDSPSRFTARPTKCARRSCP